MAYFLPYILFLSCSVQISLQRSTPEETHYIAAVVEYKVSSNVEQNRLNYISHIEEAAKQNADIIVFPEMTLTNRTTTFSVPMHSTLKQYPVPALHPELYDNLLVSMSAAARDNQIYVVINTRELMDCSRNDTGEECPELKEYVFNTNVVLDRNGTVIDRYRKINLFGEYIHTPALNHDLGQFHTDFGVTFGHFICFDLMFQVPAVQIVQKLRVTDIVFPTMWFSELPYLTAVQIQEAYAYKMNVNLIAAGANNVAVGSAGSGIYSGKAGALISIMPGVATTRLLIAKVPKVPGQVSGESYPGPIYDNPSDHDGLKLITDPSLVSHISKLLVQGSQEFTLVDKDVSCHFKVKLHQAGGGDTFPHYRAIVRDGTNTYARREIGIASCSVVACKTNEFKSCAYRYRATAFSGVRSFSGVATGANRVCSVVACTGDTLDTCGHRFTQYAPSRTAVFEELIIIGTMPTPVRDSELETDDFILYPVASKTTIMPLEPKDYVFGANTLTNASEFKFELINTDVELYSFALWGRVFGRDGEPATPPVPEQPDTPDASAIIELNKILLTPVFILLGRLLKNYH